MVDIVGVSPHMFRRTVATAVNENGTVDLPAKLLGHTDLRITMNRPRFDAVSFRVRKEDVDDTEEDSRADEAACGAACS